MRNLACLARRNLVSLSLILRSVSNQASTFSQDVHISYGDPNPHYTFFGFSRVNGDRSPEELYRERWFVHAYVDGNRNVVGVRYGKSTKRRRRNLGTLEMREVSVSLYSYFSLLSTDVFLGPF